MKMWVNRNQSVELTADQVGDEVSDLAERSRAWELLAKRHPNLTDLAPPENAEVATMAADCKHVSVLDYNHGLGHTETLTLAETSV